MQQWEWNRGPTQQWGYHNWDVGCFPLPEGCLPIESTGFTQQAELKAAFNLCLQHSKSKPESECRSKAVV